MPSTSPNSSEKISDEYSVVKLRNSAPRPSITTRMRAVDTSRLARRLSQPMPSDPTRANTPETDQRVDAEQAGAGSPGERALRHRVGHERGAAQHDEEADHAGDDRDDRGHDPGVDHERGKHCAYPPARRLRPRPAS